MQHPAVRRADEEVFAVLESAARACFPRRRSVWSRPGIGHSFSEGDGEWTGIHSSVSTTRSSDDARLVVRIVDRALARVEDHDWGCRLSLCLLRLRSAASRVLDLEPPLRPLVDRQLTTRHANRAVCAFIFIDGVGRMTNRRWFGNRQPSLETPKPPSTQGFWLLPTAGERFELSDESPRLRFSRPPRSAAPAPRRGSCCTRQSGRLANA
jgi:hypothetical protein